MHQIDSADEIGFPFKATDCSSDKCPFEVGANIDLHCFAVDHNSSIELESHKSKSNDAAHAQNM